jgi:hypothetical protein
MTAPVQKQVTFVDFDIPPLKVGRYTVTATHKVDLADPIISDAFSASVTFAVAGNRFQLSSDDIVSVFPQPLANGEFDGVLPHVVLQRSALPWQRGSVKDAPAAPWLAVLLLQADELPSTPPFTATAADIFPNGQAIMVDGSSSGVTGTMPAGTISYPFTSLDVGQTPKDPCTIIDLPLATFCRVAPSAADLVFLAHVRQVDSFDGEDATTSEIKRAIVLGNRLPRDQAEAYGLLVSLEGMGDLLPDDQGNPSSSIPAGTTTVRLIVFRSWRFFANDLDEGLKALLENLNRDSTGTLGLTSLRLPAPPPSQSAVATARQDQSTGALTASDADALVSNALALGYVPMNHHLREAGNTVSWYRGGCVPCPVPAFVKTPVSCPDALLRYDPQTGLFDASYAAAWQLGQLMALQSRSFSTSLYTWKRSEQRIGAARAEHALIARKLAGLLPEVMKVRAAALANLPAPPPAVVDFIGRLKLLKGVPFAYLVPDESMLPVESLRMFQLDPNWIEALVDGAFSIARAGSGELQQDGARLAMLRPRAAAAARTQRRNDPPHLMKIKAAAGDADFGPVSGFLLRSQAVSGWPRLNAQGYADTAGDTELPKLRLARLGQDVLLGLFEGVLQRLDIREAAEQLHCGVEPSNGTLTTTLRALSGAAPGQPLPNATAEVAVRGDGQTLQVAVTSNTIVAALGAAGQGVSEFTAAEFAVEMTKGVVSVAYLAQT